MNIPDKYIFGLTSSEYRPCLVELSNRMGKKEKRKALFHKWTYEQEPVESGVMRESRPAGQLSTTRGIIEMEDGQVLMVVPYLIQFVDGKQLFDQYAWGGRIIMTRTEAAAALQMIVDYSEEVLEILSDAEECTAKASARISIKVCSAAIEALLEKIWTSPEEALPVNPNEQVLAVVSGEYKGRLFDNAFLLGTYTKEGWILEMFPGWEHPNVTHWMPLPELPEEADDDQYSFEEGEEYATD